LVATADGLVAPDLSTLLIWWVQTCLDAFPPGRSKSVQTSLDLPEARSPPRHFGLTVEAGSPGELFAWFCGSGFAPRAVALLLSWQIKAKARGL